MNADPKRTRSAWRLLFPVFAIIATGLYGILLVRYGPANFDAPLLLWFRDGSDLSLIAGPEWVTSFWQALSGLGKGTPRIVVAGSTVLSLLLLRRWQSAVLAIGILSSGNLLKTALKVWVGRPRPQLVAHLDHVGSQSFPSGHAFNGMLFYMTLAILLLAPSIRQRRVRWIVYGVAVSMSAGIGISRVALGVHYPTDVLASWVVGMAWLWLWFGVASRYSPTALPWKRVDRV